ARPRGPGGSDPWFGTRTRTRHSVLGRTRGDRPGRIDRGRHPSGPGPAAAPGPTASPDPARLILRGGDRPVWRALSPRGALSPAAPALPSTRGAPARSASTALPRAGFVGGAPRTPAPAYRGSRSP